MKMELPGCTPQTVKQVDWDRHGVTLRLACGHRLWKGGSPLDPSLHFIENEDSVPCQSSPCYREQRYFGV